MTGAIELVSSSAARGRALETASLAVVPLSTRRAAVRADAETASRNGLCDLCLVRRGSPCVCCRCRRPSARLPRWRADPRVVNELHRALVPSRGLFASGKFDQYKRDIPYATLAQAFQSLVRSLLTQSEAKLGWWRDSLNEALGPNGQLIVNLVPELGLVIGKQPPVPDLPPQDAQNRFQIGFRRFLAVFARKEHPLALFLDDLQWLDAATLDLLEHLVTHTEVRHLLLVGAYRDNA